MKLGIIQENIKISLKSIKSNLLKSILTVLIIAVGIMALTGIMTAIESIKTTLSEQFSSLGANSFAITRLNSNVMGGRGRVENKRISFYEAERFKREFQFPSVVSISVIGSSYTIVKYKNEKTNPTITILGTDENYLPISKEELEDGRNFTTSEVSNGNNIVIIGNQLKEKLFKNNEKPIENFILIGSIKYRVLGVLKSKGSSMGGNEDNICIIPINNARLYFDTQYNNYKISIMPHNPELLEMAVSESEGLFRKIRNLNVKDENNFEIRKSDSLVKMVMENTKVLTAGATIIGLLTLLGAAIGLMNIMLVSVSERTMEIGVRKAIGAKPTTIKQQFLFEAIIIGQIGGIFGVILGIIAGNVVALLTKTLLVFPIFWIIVGIILCLIVSIIAGYFPAVKASKLDPIIALHYE